MSEPPVRTTLEGRSYRDNCENLGFRSECSFSDSQLLSARCIHTLRTSVTSSLPDVTASGLLGVARESTGVVAEAHGSMTD